jgi:hypothetical protein
MNRLAFLSSDTGGVEERPSIRVGVVMLLVMVSCRSGWCPGGQAGDGAREAPATVKLARPAR